MKTTSSILIALTALTVLSLEGCEYYEGKSVYVPISGDQRDHETDIAVTDPTETVLPSEEVTAIPAVDDAGPAPEDAPLDDQDEIQTDDASADEPAPEGEEGIVEIVREKAKHSRLFIREEPKEVAFNLRTSFSVTPSSLTTSLPEMGGLNAGGSCRQNAPAGPEAGVALQTTLHPFDDGRPALLTGLFLGCHKTTEWIDPEETDRSADWNAGIRFDDSPLEGEFRYGQTFPVGRALIGVKLVTCRLPEGSIGSDFCGAAGLYRAVHPNGSIEDEIEEELIAPQESIVRSNDFALTIRCQDPEEVVTRVNFRRPENASDSPVKWVELFCGSVEGR